VDITTASLHFNESRSAQATLEVPPPTRLIVQPLPATGAMRAILDRHRSRVAGGIVGDAGQASIACGGGIDRAAHAGATRGQMPDRHRSLASISRHPSPTPLRPASRSMRPSKVCQIVQLHHAESRGARTVESLHPDSRNRSEPTTVADRERRQVGPAIRRRPPFVVPARAHADQARGNRTPLDQASSSDFWSSSARPTSPPERCTRSVSSPGSLLLSIISSAEMTPWE